jgi:hypothetical protein
VAGHLDQQRGLVGRRQRRPLAIAVEPRGQRRVPRRQLGTEAPIERDQPRRFVEIRVTEAFYPEREVPRLVAWRASRAIREGKFRGGQSPSS